MAQNTLCAQPSGKYVGSKTPLFLGVSIELSQLRPIAFRVFTKRHNLTLKSDAFKELAAFIGRKCGQNWHEESESVLDEIARLWKKSQGL